MPAAVIRADSTAREIRAILNSELLRREPTILGYRNDGTNLHVRFKAALAAPWVQFHVQTDEAGEGGATYDASNYKSTTLVDCRDDLLQDVTTADIWDSRYYIWLIPAQEDGEGNTVLYNGVGGNPDNMVFIDDHGHNHAVAPAVPATITVTAGGTPVGTVANVQAMLDGDVYQIPEAAATPGFDIRFNFTGITFSPNAICYRAWYDGTSTHEVTVEIYDYDATAFVILHQFEFSQTYKLEKILFPVDANYLDSGAAIVRFVHNTGGNASHDIYWDYVSLLSISGISL